MKIINTTVLIILILLVCFGCTNSIGTPDIGVQLTLPPTWTNTPTDTIQPSSTRIPTKDFSTFTPTPTRTLRPTPEIISTLSENEILGTLDAFSLSCKLPCLYGIIPGETTFNQAFRILASIGVHEWVYYPDDYSGVMDNYETHTFIISTKKEYNGRSYLNQYISVVNETVAKIKSESFYSLPQALRELGIPSNVWVRLNISLSEDGPPPFPFGIALYYAEKNIGIVYYVINGIPIGDAIQACITDQAIILIGSEEIPLTYASFDLISGYETQPSLEEALGIDIDEFYENNKDQNSNVCFQTSYDIWTLPKRNP